MIYYILILLGILTRILPHAPNFTAVAAVALFSGYYIKNKKDSFSGADGDHASFGLENWILVSEG